MDTDPTFLRLPDVIARTGLSRANIYARARAGTFPRPIALSRRASAWVESEVSGWIRAQIERARGTNSPRKGDAA